MQFCRMYTGADGKSHFEELDQQEGSKFFLTTITPKALVFKNDLNRVDLHGWHNAPPMVYYTLRHGRYRHRRRHGEDLQPRRCLLSRG